MWHMYHSVLRATTTFGVNDWMHTFACLTLLSFVVLLLFGNRQRA